MFGGFLGVRGCFSASARSPRHHAQAQGPSEGRSTGSTRGGAGPRRAESPRQRGRFLPQEPLRVPSGCRQEKPRWQQLPNGVWVFPP